MKESTYKQVMQNIQTPENLEGWILQAVRQENTEAHRGARNIKRVLIIAVAALLMAAISFGAFANISRQSFSEIAQMLAEQQEAEEYPLGDYMVRLCGFVTEEAILKQFGCPMQEEDHTYFLVSIRRADGAEIDYWNGYKPVDWTGGVFISGIPIEAQPFVRYGTFWPKEEDGIVYELYDIDHLDIFADHTAYFAIYEPYLTDLYEQKYGKRSEEEAVVYAPFDYVLKLDEDGFPMFLSDYPKGHLLLELPLDESGADPERAQEYLEEYGPYRTWVKNTELSIPEFEWESVDDILELYRPGIESIDDFREALGRPEETDDESPTDQTDQTE